MTSASILSSQKQNTNKHKISRRKIVRAETSEIENRKTIKKINKIKHQFVEVNKIDKPLARVIKENKREDISTNNRNERDDITRYSANIKSIIRN